MKVGDLVSIRELWREKGFNYGYGVVLSLTEYDRFFSCKIQWESGILFHPPEELEIVSESR